MDTNARPWRERALTASTALLAAAVSVSILQRAWLNDDSYITLRTIDNLVQGFGLRWNVAERVQAFTHPLWMFELAAAYAFTREAYFTTLTVSVITSVAFVALFVRYARLNGPVAVLFGLLAMLSSRALIDFSTGGLENPLSHLLIVACFLVLESSPASPTSIARASLLTSLAMLNRLDLGIFLLPPLLAYAARLRLAATLPALALGMIPLLAWEMFSILYYGTLVPNTVYAKLYTGVPVASSVRQGAYYMVESLASDPATLVIVALAAAIGLRAGASGRRSAAIGLIAGVVWIIWTGGDFMSGRFLTPVFVAALCLLTASGVLLPRAVHSSGTDEGRRLPEPPAPRVRNHVEGYARAVKVAIALAAFLVVARLAGANARTALASGDPMFHGIIDERSAYAGHTALFLFVQHGERIPHEWERQGMDARASAPPVVVRAPIGFYGYYAGPAVHVLDVLALADPLLARLPSRGNARIGHFARYVPDGYVESLITDSNRLKDRRLVTYYDDIRLVTRGPLWTRERLSAILRLNTRRPPRPSVWIG